MNNFDELEWVREKIDDWFKLNGANVVIFILSIFNIVLIVTR